MKKIGFVTHVALINGSEYDGIGNLLQENLNFLKVDFIRLKHSMNGDFSSHAYFWNQSKVSKISKVLPRIRLSVIRYLGELIASFIFFSKIRIDVFVGVDPLNALAGLMLKKCGFTKKVIFYSADYSQNRFTNFVLNSAYHLIDKYCAKHADEVWSVSTAICEIRNSIGVANEKNIFMPNVPPIEFQRYRKNSQKTLSMVMTGILDQQLDFSGAIKVVAELAATYNNIELYIIGNGPREIELRNLSDELGVASRVVFTGNLSLSETLDLVSRCGIGLALYTGAWSFNINGDSTKCREYFFYSLPVISTRSHSTVDQIEEYNAGLVVEPLIEDYVHAVVEVVENYAYFASGAERLGKKYENIQIERLRALVCK